MLLSFNFDIIFRKQIEMIESAKHSMEIIAEESSRLSQAQWRQVQSSSFELLIKAHDRIRVLEEENEDLRKIVEDNQRSSQRINLLEKQLDRLLQLGQDKDTRIQNLEAINAKAIKEYLHLQRQFKQGKIKRPISPNVVPKELDSPLNLSGLQEMNHNRNASIRQANNFLAEHQRLTLLRSPQKQQHWELFTFDKGNVQRNQKHPPLKNCFSEIQMNAMVTKVCQRQPSSTKSKQQLRHYHNYCSSIQKKYTPYSPKSPPIVKGKQSQLRLKSPVQYTKPNLGIAWRGNGQKVLGDTSASFKTTFSYSHH